MNDKGLFKSLCKDVSFMDEVEDERVIVEAGAGDHCLHVVVGGEMALTDLGKILSLVVVALMELYRLPERNSTNSLLLGWEDLL